MARPEGAQANADEDTVYLALAGALATDLSQQLTNITALAPGAHETPSTRSILTSSRTASIRWVAAAAAEVGKVLFISANALQTDIVWAIATDGAGRICGYQANLVGIIQATAPTAAKDYTIWITTRANPDTTGAADALISELGIYNHTDSTLDDLVQAVHAIPLAAAGPYSLTIGGWYNGAALTNTPVNAPTEARVSTSPHPGAEEGEDWTPARPAYTGVEDFPTEPIGPRPSSSGLGDESQIAGRSTWAYAAAHALQSRRRSWAPLINEILNATDAMPTAQVENWDGPAPGAPLYRMDLSWLRWGQVAAEATHLRMYVHVRQWVTGGAAVELGLRAYVLNRPPAMAQIGAQSAPSLIKYYGGAAVEVDDEFGPGVWLELGAVAIPRFELPITGWRDSLHVGLAYAVDPSEESGNDAAARFVVDGWVAIPVVADIPWQVVEL